MGKNTNRARTEMCTLSPNRATGQDAVGQFPANPIPLAARSNRASKEEFQLRVGYVVQMLLDGRPKYQIKAFFRRE